MSWPQRLRWLELSPRGWRNLRVVAYVVPTVIAGIGLQVALGSSADAKDAAARARAVAAHEADEAQREVAQACIDQHDRYPLFEDLASELTRAGARVGADAHLAVSGASAEEAEQVRALIDDLLPGATGPILNAYPPPSCNRGEAMARLSEPEKPDPADDR